MLQQDMPDDYVLATGATTYPRIRHWPLPKRASKSARQLEEEGYCQSGNVLVKVIPGTSGQLSGSADRRRLQSAGPTRLEGHVHPPRLCREMVQADLNLVQRTTT